MALYIVLCEDHRRNVVIVGNHKGGPYENREQASNVASMLKLRFPLREFNAMEIVGMKVEDPTAEYDPMVVKPS